MARQSRLSITVTFQERRPHPSAFACYVISQATISSTDMQPGSCAKNVAHCVPDRKAGVAHRTLLLYFFTHQMLCK